MSAQVGVWNFDGRPVDQVSIRKLTRSIEPYGPDGGDVYAQSSIAVVYRAFHTTLESCLEHQPYVSPRGSVVVWEGRLDNRDELIVQLRDELRDLTDVAIVATAFDRWERDCFHRLIGDWAISVWNPQSKELLLARDYMGTRTLFYYLRMSTITWCTYLAPLITFDGSLNLCDQYIASYLALWPEPHLTPYRDHHSVPPGQFVRICDRQISSRTFWTLNPKVKVRYKDERDYEQHFLHLFRQAVRRRLRSNSHVLADLSGGLDSSAIVCMADDIVAKGESRAVLDTFSFYDPHEPDEEDLLYFGKVEQQRNRTGHHVELRRADDAFAVVYPSFVAAPGFEARQGLKEAKSSIIEQGKYRVVLSGTGGDEVLGNTLDPRVQLADLFVRLRLWRFGEQLLAWSLSSRQSMIELLCDAISLLFPLWLRRRITAGSTDVSWIDERFAKRSGLYRNQLVAAEGQVNWLPSIRDWQQTIKALSGQLTHARPVQHENRYPYLDRTLVEFLVAIPTTQLLRPGDRRRLMRRSLADLLPPEILCRNSKSGTGRCISITLQTHWQTVERALESPLTSELGFINKSRFRSALLAAKGGHLGDDIVMLLKGLSLELWLRDVVSRNVISFSSTKSQASQSYRTCLGHQA